MLRSYAAKCVSVLFAALFMFVPASSRSLHFALSANSRIAPLSDTYRPPVAHLVRDTRTHWVPRFYHVRSGDTLSKIATHYYRNPRYWPTLWDYDKKIANPNLIYVGEKLWIPYHPTARITRRIPQVSTSPRPHTVVTDYTTYPTHDGSIQSYVVEVFGGNAGCADTILNHESGLSWSDVTISNPGSGAYGLPQALPGYKMASAGSDWATNPLTQLRWMYGYVNSVYGGVCNAAYHDINTGTY